MKDWLEGDVMALWRQRFDTHSHNDLQRLDIALLADQALITSLRIQAQHHCVLVWCSGKRLEGGVFSKYFSQCIFLEYL